jgi:hypothetical protein
MNTAVMDTLAAAGLNLSVTADGRLHVNPIGKLTGELADLIRANKPQLVDWLRAANDPAPFDFFRHKKEAAGLGQICNPGKSDPGKGCNLQCDPFPAPMTPGEVDTFSARVLLYTRRGLTASHAEAMADRHRHRDRERDDRRACIECRALSGRNCTAWRKAGIGSPQIGPLIAKLQRCPAYAPAITITEETND